MPASSPGEDEELTASLAAAEEISTDAAIVAVILRTGRLFCIIRRTRSGNDGFFPGMALLLTGFGMSLV